VLAQAMPSAGPNVVNPLAAIFTAPPCAEPAHTLPLRSSASD
jgi:hypothetical protein